MTSKQLNEVVVFGITGGIACGKSTVTKTFLQANIPIIDADLVARKVVEPNSIGLAMVVKQFGKEILFDDGALCRGTLGELVYQNQENLTKLNSILHPLIAKESSKQIEELKDSGNKLIGYDAALLIEAGLADKFRPLILVMCKPETQLQRLMKRNFLSRDEALARIQSQMSSEEKVRHADFIINTDKEISYSVEQTQKIIGILQERVK